MTEHEWKQLTLETKRTLDQIAENNRESEIGTSEDRQKLLSQGMRIAQMQFDDDLSLLVTVAMAKVSNETYALLKRRAEEANK